MRIRNRKPIRNSYLLRKILNSYALAPLNYALGIFKSRFDLLIDHHRHMLKYLSIVFCTHPAVAGRSYAYLLSNAPANKPHKRSITIRTRQISQLSIVREFMLQNVPKGNACLGFCIDIEAPKSAVGMNSFNCILQNLGKEGISRVKYRNSFRFDDVPIEWFRLH